MTKTELKRHLMSGKTVTFEDGCTISFNKSEFYFTNIEDGMPQEWPFNLIFETYKDMK